MSQRATGIYYDVPAEEYYAPQLGLVRKSSLDQIARSPAHYYSWVNGQDSREPTAALLFGSAFHCSILEPDIFTATYVVEPEFGDCRKTDKTTKEDAKVNKTKRAEWQKEHAAQKKIASDDHHTIAQMTTALMGHQLAGPMLRAARREVSIYWRDAETGLDCRARADGYAPSLGVILDVKSTEDASLEEFRRSCGKYGYHRQDALYRTGFAAVGETQPNFCLIACEKKPPYAVACYTLDQDAVDRGYLSTRKHMRTMASCLAEGRWPAYPAKITELSLPKWIED